MSLRLDILGLCKVGYVAVIIPANKIAEHKPIHSTGFSHIDSYTSAEWREIPKIESTTELNRWSPVVVAFIWLIFFGYTKETRRLYGPILRRVWEFTPFATRRSALEPLAFGSVAAQPRRSQGEMSDLSQLSTDGSIQPATAITDPTSSPPDIESQDGNDKGAGGRSGPRWRLWPKGAAN